MTQVTPMIIMGYQRSFKYKREGIFATYKVNVVLITKTIMGTTGVGEVTLINSNTIAKTSFVAGLLFDKAFV